MFITSNKYNGIKPQEELTMEFLTAIAAFITKLFAAVNFHAIGSAIGGFLVLAFKFFILKLMVNSIFKVIKHFRDKHKKDKESNDDN